MNYVLIAICIVAVVIVVAAMVYSKNKKNEVTEDDCFVGDLRTSTGDHSVNVDKENTELVIPVEMLPAETAIDESRLVEITDSKVLAHVNNLVPGLAQAGVAANNAVQAAQAGNEVLYRAIIPVGAVLADSRDMNGAVRGIYRGTNKIRGHANLVPVEAQKGAEVVANTAAAAMGVASMVVGQYYMTQINAELGEISDGISRISNFQDNEFRSRVFSLVAHVEAIAGFQSEILENDELRLSKISQLDSLSEECTQLLGQADLTIAGFARKTDLDYETYEKELGAAHNWYTYQNALLKVLYKISELKYTLHLGKVSREQCSDVLPTYIKQVSDAQARLANWHSVMTERLHIDTENKNRKRSGVDWLIHQPETFFFENVQNVRPISDKTAGMISEQSTGETGQQDTSDLYNEDVELIAKDGKIYYLPQKDGE